MAFQRKETDYLPLVNPTSIATLESMRLSRAFFPESHFDAEKMVRLAAAGYENIGFDTIAPYFSVQLEAAALGCEVDWGTRDSMPSIVKSPFRIGDDFAISGDFLDRSPVREMLSALKMLRRKFPQTALVGKVIGPLTLAYHLFGVQNVVMDLLLDSPKLLENLSSLVELSLSFATAQMETGIDVLTWADHATDDIMSAQSYRKVLLPIHQYAVRKLGREIPTVLHLCGNVGNRIKYVRESGFTALQVHSHNDFARCIENAAGKMIIMGGVNNPGTLANGTTNDVRREVEMILHSGVTFVTPECALPTRTANDNLREIVAAVRGFSQ